MSRKWIIIIVIVVILLVIVGVVMYNKNKPTQDAKPSGNQDSTEQDTEEDDDITDAELENDNGTQFNA